MSQPVFSLLRTVAFATFLLFCITYTAEARESGEPTKERSTPPTEEYFFIELPPVDNPIPPPPKDGEEWKIPPPPSVPLYKTELPNASGTLEVCAVRGEMTVLVYSSVAISLERNNKLIKVHLNNCAVFSGREIRMHHPTGTSMSRARVRIVECPTKVASEPLPAN